MYIIKCETDCQSRLDAWDKCSGLVHWDDPEGWDGEGGGRGGSAWRTHVNPWLILVNVWKKPLQCCKVISLQLIGINEKKCKKKKRKLSFSECLVETGNSIDQIGNVLTSSLHRNILWWPWLYKGSLINLIRAFVWYFWMPCVVWINLFQSKHNTRHST